MEWDTLVYRAISQGLVKASDVDVLTQGGADFAEEPDEIVSESSDESDYTIGYHNDRPCLYDEEKKCGYYVPSGFAYEQASTGFAWQTISVSDGRGGEVSVLLP